MTYFSLIAVVEHLTRLEEALAVHDAMREVEPYRRYLEAEDLLDARRWARDHPEQAEGVDLEDGTAVLSRYLNKDVLVDAVDGIPAFYYMRNTNPHGELDGWEIGGGWKWRFKPYEPVHPEVIRPTEATDPAAARAGWVTGGPKGALDLEGTRETFAKGGAKRWDDYNTARKRHPTAHGWSTFVMRHLTEPDDYPLERARAEYHDQPLVKALEPGRSFLSECPIDEYENDRAAYVKLMRDSAIPAGALLTLEGEWIKPGPVGMFGLSGADKDDEVIYRDRAKRLHRWPGR